jgi:hypothetical protein
MKQNQPFRSRQKRWPKESMRTLAEAILTKVEVGLSAQRIYEDLVEESGFSDSYQSVKRFVRKLRSIQPDRVWRPECQPGEELQLDFASLKVGSCHKTGKDAKSQPAKHAK